MIQNKLHFAATGKTAPELIEGRADATKPNMGLTNWKGAVVRKADVIIAKNYLNQEEVEELNRIVLMFLDYAEDQTRRRKQIFMDDWQTKLNEFLRFHERDVLNDAGAISRDAADEKAQKEYERFSERRRAKIEAQAERDAMRELEDQAKKLPNRPNKKKRNKANGEG